MHPNEPVTSLNPQPPAGPVHAVNQRFMRLLNAENSPLTAVWGVVAGLSLLSTMVTAFVQVSTGAPMLHELFDPDALMRASEAQSGSNLIALIAYPLTLLICTVYYGSMRVIGEVDRRGGGVSFGEGGSLILERFIPTGIATLLFFLATFVGSMCCVVPGLVAMFFLYLAPYIVAARGESVGSAISQSTDWAKRHWVLLLMICGIAMVGGLGFVLIQTVALALFHGALGTTGVYLGYLATWCFAAVVGYFMWLYTGSVLVTIDRAEANYR